MRPLSPEAGARRLWSGVAALAVAEAVSWGVLFYAFGVLLPAMESELGVARSTLTAVFSAALLVAGLAAVPAGKYLGRCGARRVMTFGSIAAALLLWRWSRCETVIDFALVWLGLGVAHALVLYEPAFAAVTSWFADARARSRALLAITLMGGLASTIFLPVTGVLLAAHGWRSTVTVLAVVFAAVTIPLHLSLPSHRQRRTAPGTTAATWAHRNPRRGFGWLIAALALQGGLYGVVVVHAVPLLVEAGHSTVRAASLVGMFGVFQLAGRLTSLSWTTPAKRGSQLTWLFMLQVIAAVALAGARHEAAIWVFAVAFGASNGLLTLARPLTVAEWHGREAFAAASGRVAAWTQSARAVAPVVASGVHGWTGGYSLVIVLLVAFGVASVAAVQVAMRANAGEIKGGFPASSPELARQQQ